jgi:class 3 adenylate cyclase
VARHRLPSGTVTFLFTDIEGFTRLLNELGEQYADVLAEHGAHSARRSSDTEASRSTRLSRWPGGNRP